MQSAVKNYMLYNTNNMYMMPLESDLLTFWCAPILGRHVSYTSVTHWYMVWVKRLGYTYTTKSLHSEPRSFSARTAASTV